MRRAFLSYRRDDTQFITATLYHELEEPSAFGPKSVFMDIDDIPPGVDFRDVIDEAVSKCEFFLAVIGRRWVSSRLTDPNDFVRLEIEAALRRNIPVTPLLVDGATMPRKEELPDSLHPLLFKNAVVIRHGKDFKPDVLRLVEGLRKAAEWFRTRGGGSDLASGGRKPPDSGEPGLPDSSPFQPPQHLVLRTALLKDGSTLQYEEEPEPHENANNDSNPDRLPPPPLQAPPRVRKVYFTPDRSQVVALFLESEVSSADRLARLEDILGRYNLTTDPETGEYWKKLFCWPTGIVTKPMLGFVAPCALDNFYFETGPFKGKEKKTKWFTSRILRGYLPLAERGTFLNYFQIGIQLVRAIGRLHSAGLCNADLSSENVLIDPVNGECLVCGVEDLLVVPSPLSHEALGGTVGYVAPEMLSRQNLPHNNNNNNHKQPDALANLHSLAVLLYELLLFRHPLRGPKIHAIEPAEDEYLSMGPKALFVEHPTDRSNRPPDLGAQTADLGPQLHGLFERAFVKGLHAPNDRPTAIGWERALVHTWDLLHPCANANCSHKWFVVHAPTVTRCPFCQTKMPQG